jgi:DNA-binding beta-propeller fold protein YncE
MSYCLESTHDIVLTNTGKGEIVKFSADGKEIWRTKGFQYPTSLSIYQKDKSVWIADNYNNQVVKLSPDGKELLRLSGFKKPRYLEVDQSDGAVWVCDYINSQVVKLSPDGKELLKISGKIKSPYHLSLNQKNGTVWIADFFGGELIGFSRDGVELVRVNINGHPCHISVDQADGSVLAACAAVGHKVVRVSKDGKIIQTISEPVGLGVQRVYVDNVSRDFWVFFSDSAGWIVRISRFDKDGGELVNFGHYNTMDLDPTSFSSLSAGKVLPDGTMLISDVYANDRVIHLSKKGDFLRTIDNLSSVMSIDIEE